jgi:hypothetical protein
VVSLVCVTLVSSVLYAYTHAIYFGFRCILVWSIYFGFIEYSHHVLVLLFKTYILGKIKNGTEHVLISKSLPD